VAILKAQTDARQLDSSEAMGSTGAIGPGRSWTERGDEQIESAAESADRIGGFENELEGALDEVRAPAFPDTFAAECAPIARAKKAAFMGAHSVAGLNRDSSAKAGALKKRREERPRGGSDQATRSLAT
ncbi:unnamed protein product, partial [Prorocentrum cordatum]